MSDVIIKGTDKNFDQEVKCSDIPVLVDFWAPWCGPCKQLTPVVDEIADQYKGRLKVVKVNVDENPVITNEWDVRGIPALMLFINGDIVESKVGAQGKHQMTTWLDKHV